MWEHNEQFREKLRRVRASAIDMETATIFTASYANKIQAGALHLVSDQPMVPEGIKTAKSDSEVTKVLLIVHLSIFQVK